MVISPTTLMHRYLPVPPWDACKHRTGQIKMRDLVDIPMVEIPASGDAMEMLGVAV